MILWHEGRAVTRGQGQATGVTLCMEHFIFPCNEEAFEVPVEAAVQHKELSSASCNGLEG